MATIRCMDVADSAKFVVERSFAIVAEGSSSLRCSSRYGTPGHGNLLGKAAVKEPWTPNAALTTKRSMRFGSSTREWPGVSFFCAAQKGVARLLRTKENDVGVAALLTRVEGRSSTEGRQFMQSFFAWIRGSLLQGACGRCQQRSSRKQRSDSDSECRQDGRGSGRSMSVGGATRALVFSVMLCETQPFRDWRFCWQGQCHHCLDHRG